MDDEFLSEIAKHLEKPVDPDAPHGFIVKVSPEDMKRLEREMKTVKVEPIPQVLPERRWPDDFRGFGSNVQPKKRRKV
jgi:hypothetical protein